MNLFWNKYTRGSLLKIFNYFPIKRSRILCFSWAGQKYSDDPRAITDELIKSIDLYEWEIIYAFYSPDNFTDELPKTIFSVTLGSMRYFYLLATSHFIISNVRLNQEIWPFKKRSGQFYIQTMHGGHGMKRIELDVKDSLSKDYIDALYADAAKTDLMLSDSSFFTNLIRSSLGYPEGEILEVGLPSHDIFFSSLEEKNKVRKRVLAELNLKDDISNPVKLIIYCPTFRNNGRRDVYGFNTDCVMSALENRFGGNWYILVTSHPNMSSYYRQLYDFSHPRLIDVGNYPDFQRLLLIADALITDYSSAAFVFSLSYKPVFLLVRDLEDYDRGVYFDIRKLPFPFSDKEEELCNNILNYDDELYQNELKSFNNTVVGLKAKGNATKEVVRWIIRHK